MSNKPTHSGVHLRDSRKMQLLENFIEWARTQVDIRAVILAGSTGRKNNPADEWSDYDLIVVTTDPPQYLTSMDWLVHIGNPWVSVIERTSAGEPFERRVLFEGGFDMDFIIISPENILRDFNNKSIVLEIIQSGRQVLLDKDAILSNLLDLSLPVQAVTRPSYQTFQEVVNDFWFHVAWTAKKIKRGELWVAKNCCDTYLKNLLLRMIEWEAKSVNGWDFNTWFNGRFLERWALPQTVDELHGVFAIYNAESVWQALQATQVMFRRVAMETASHLGYSYPIVCDEKVSNWITQIRVGIQ
jgi:aminoglycoside 6-adenylyltransferase